MPETRPLRLCDSCGQVDDHPRHVYATNEGESPTSAEVAEKALSAVKSADDRTEILRQIMDTSTTVKHMDCCAADGCQICPEVLSQSGAPEGTTGAKLVKALTSGKVDGLGESLTERNLQVRPQEA